MGRDRDLSKDRRRSRSRDKTRDKKKKRSSSRDKRRKSKRDDSYERRRRKDDKKKRRRRRSSSSDSSGHRGKSRKSRRRSNSREKEAKRQARLAKARLLSLQLMNQDNELEEDMPLKQEEEYDENAQFKEQLRLFEESGLEGKKLTEEEKNENGEKPDIADDTNTGEELKEDSRIKSDALKPKNAAQDANKVTNSNQNNQIDKDKGSLEPKVLPKSEFVSMNSSVSRSNNISAPKIIGSLNLAGTPSTSKVKNIFEDKSSDSPQKAPIPPPAPLPFNKNLENEADSNKEDATAQEDEEDDPFEAFMKGVEQEACAQDDLGMDKKDEENVISYEDILKMNNDQTESVMEQSNMDSDEEMEIDNAPQKKMDEETYHQEFMKKLKRETVAKEQEVFFSDDDDEFIENFEAKKETGTDDYLEKQKKANEKRELLLSHKMQRRGELEPFQKNFYIEPKEITDMTEEHVEQYRKDLGDVAVRGVQCPRPIMTWYQWGLTQRILTVLEKKNFEEPRPIQKQALPAIMGGRDVIGIAETGSGKTLAYLLPMLRHILNQRPIKEGDGMIGLVVAPTRELAQQIYNETKLFTKYLNLNAVCVYGGADVGSQLSQLKRGAEIVVWTPGRMIEVLTTNGGKFTNLHRVTYLVLDEADRMLDMGFEPQISRIIGGCRDDRQTVMFSATFPKTIVSLAKRILTSPLEIVVGNRGQACKAIEQFVEIIEEDDKLLRLTQILDKWINIGSVLIFVDSQKEADELFENLFKLGYKLFTLHGGIDHTDREYTIQDFKKGIRKIMVATSIAARGLDIKSIRVVINYKCPNHMEDYIHRIGRTGRAGNAGTAYTFITSDEEHYASDLVKALKSSEQPVSQELLELDEEYQRKVREGEIAYKKKYTVATGRGYDFTEEERKKFADSKKNQEKGLFAEAEEEISDSEIKIREAGETEDENFQLSDHRLNEILRDPKAKQIAREASLKATKEALVQGLEGDKIVELADKAIMEALSTYRPQSKFEKGMEQAMKVRDSFMDRENESSDHFTAKFEINDYPQNSRSKVCSRDFLSTIYDLTGCQVSVRGTHFEQGKAVPMGQTKQYLFIEGSSKHEVANAYKELKRVLDESASAAAASGMGGAGKYNVI